jgi:hypothetical protein
VCQGVREADVIGALLDDGVGPVLLATPGIHRHNVALQVSQGEEVGKRCARMGFGINLHRSKERRRVLPSIATLSPALRSLSVWGQVRQHGVHAPESRWASIRRNVS